jgi:glycosyltransferase involved in cell wall biosynthesis
MRVLYITYDGLLEPLGQSQVLGYLKRLAVDHEIWLLSFEKNSDWKNERVRLRTIDATERAGIYWRALRYHKSPSTLATLYDILVGTIVGAIYVVRYQLSVVHTRSYVPSIIALALKKLFRTHFIFDMRGFWADERVDRGVWRQDSRGYRIAKWFEKMFFLNADTVVSLTDSGADAIRALPYLRNRPPKLEIIRTCADLELFKPSENGFDLKRDQSFTLGSVGSIKPWYHFDPVIDFFVALRALRKEARLLVINRDQHDFVRQRIRECGVPPESIILKSLPYTQVPAEMRRMRAGIFFVNRILSENGVMPVRLGEFLACGVPCVSNDVADLRKLVEDEKVGVVIREFSPAAHAEAAARLLELLADRELSDRCVQVARKYFSVVEGAREYDRIYRALS